MMMGGSKQTTDGLKDTISPMLIMATMLKLSTATQILELFMIGTGHSQCGGMNPQPLSQIY
jgi:hypothetical protein